MSGLRSFLLCLVPALVAYVLLFFSNRIDDFFPAALVMMITGAIISGASVASFIQRKMEPKKMNTSLKVSLRIFVAWVVGIAYLALVITGCSSLELLW